MTEPTSSDRTSDVAQPVSPNGGISGDLARKISAKLIETLKKEFDDDVVLDVIQPLVPAIIEYGMREGIDKAEHILVGLGQDDPYQYWEMLIEAADPETRIELMEETRQAAIHDRLRQIERDELRWKVLKTALEVSLALLGLLLV